MSGTGVVSVWAVMIKGSHAFHLFPSFPGCAKASIFLMTPVYFLLKRARPVGAIKGLFPTGGHHISKDGNDSNCVKVSKPSLGRYQFTRQVSYELPEGRGTSGCNVNYVVSVGSSPGYTLSRPCRLFRVRNPDHVWSSHLCVEVSDPLALLTNPAIALLYCFVGV